MIRTKLVLIPLFKSLQVSTDGTTTALYLDLDAPDFKYLLPYAESLTLHTLTFGAVNGEFEWNVVFRSGYDAQHETTDITKIGPSANISTNGSARHSALTDTTKFLLESRLQVLLKNATGQSGVRTATISATLAVLTVGM